MLLVRAKKCVSTIQEHAVHIGKVSTHLIVMEGGDSYPVVVHFPIVPEDAFVRGTTSHLVGDETYKLRSAV